MTDQAEQQNWNHLNDQLSRIEGRLAKLEQAEDARQERRIEERGRCAANHANDIAIQNTVKEHDRVLRGNGNPGLVSRHERLSSKFDTVEKLLKYQIGLLVPMVVGVFGTTVYLIVELSIR